MDADFEDDVQEKTKTQPMSSINYLLFGLNIVMAVVFTFLILLNYQRRHQFTKLIFDLDIRLAGLPLDEEKDQPSASQLTDPQVSLTSEELKNAFTQRRTGKSPKSAFQSFEGTLNPTVRPEAFPEDYLKKLFANAQFTDGPVKTLEEEVRRLQGIFFESVSTGVQNEIQQTKKAANPQAAKLKLLEECLFPLATIRPLIHTYPSTPLKPGATKVEDFYTVWEQREKAKAAEATLDTMLEEALKRRVYVRFLRRQQAFRPWTIVLPDGGKAPGGPAAGKEADFLSLSDEQKKLSRKMSDALFFSADPKKVPLQNLEELVTLRFGEALGQQGKVLPVKRDSFEKRYSIAFLLVCLSDLTISPGGPPVFGQDAIKRTELILGLRLFTGGLNALAEVINQEAEDQEYFVRKDADHFVETHKNRIEEMILMLPKIYSRELDAKRADAARARAKNLFIQTHVPQFTKEIEQLVKERRATQQLVTTLSKTHNELFAAQKRRAEAAEKNQELLRTITIFEKQLLGK